MQWDPNALDFDTHRKRYEAVFGVNLHDSSQDLKTLDRARYAQATALKTHAIAVHDPLRDLFLKVVDFASSLSNQEAAYYMRYGGGRRMGMIFHGYNEIVWNAPVDRTKSLSRDEQHSLSGAINNIYMHLFGALDNFVLSILHEKETDAAAGLTPQQIYLFSPALGSLDAFRILHGELDGLRQWFRDAKTRRNPVAHRIPFYIGPAVLSNEDADLYRGLDTQFYDAIKNMDFQLADEIDQRKDELGRFAPYFIHHPGEGAISIYPTLPTDIANLIRIGRTVFALLKGEIT